MTNNKVWHDKDVRIARQSSIKASVNMLDIAERLGMLDSIDKIEELYTLQGNLSEKIFNQIWKDTE